MANPMRVVAKLSGDICTVRIIMSHPMETGLRKNSEGKVVPAHFIQTFTVSVNGAVKVDGQCGQSVSRDPAFVFRMRGPKAGDKVSVSWFDNNGETRTDEATVA